MDENTKVDQSAAEPAPKKSKKNRFVILGVVAVVVIALGAGFWKWHETAGFCAAICHTPMDEYYDTWANGTVDKSGNPVSNPAGMLAYAHANYDRAGNQVEHGAGMQCMDCHIPTISEQVHEALSWVTGDYEYPLEKRTLDDLVAARGLENSSEFCINDACHADLQSKDAFVASTAGLSAARNPHTMPHGKVDCGECHNAHTVSTNFCGSCHADSPVPEGWVSYKDFKAMSAKK
ncbi:hypothetical protein HLV37_03100 [Eggerthellaceae bacterium zg-1084]|uniref:Uncharacterized protein n=1 Tax=Berryella wangjianweii TaxID=2734634 RepID=A0A6M8J6Z7_9ACTN|nr:cytochrome c3 family protein [Berryella wangjianweii]NPD30866.1 hypothetical protein [Berryella wangjianweii]NPD31733.1 hypothetical protein [Eggerthellaceae bacterium zg-997]QKF07666.1 hypothetical protein HLV38_05715 [Berryella wangjianweii]